MIKLLALAVVAVSLAACSSMYGAGTQPNSGATKNSSDANKSGNPAAVSPGGAGAK